MENIVSENKREEGQSSTAQRDGSRRFGGLVKEVKLIGYIAGPMIIVILSQYFLQIISIMMVGHLGNLYLSSTAVAISFGVVTGFSVLYGMAGALETLSGQAYGAQQYRKLGFQTNTAIFSLILVCLPLCPMWAYMGKILILLGQDPVISREAGRFMLWFIPALFAYATLQPLVRLSTVATIYAIPEGLGAAGSTRVSNELGAGNPRAAHLACAAVMILTVFEAVIISSVLLACRSVFGQIFSNENYVADYAAKMAPLVSLAIFFRSFTAVLSGIGTGCGFQKLGAFVNLGSYYFLSIPIAAILAFRFDLRMNWDKKGEACKGEDF
ncbi:Multi antimicrobial extrusion protein [Parasponia andersonii]|uniref:Multi antimicrobial extrusion protein n=1 Tax=Parasponia andersonii TaxID=3476 RepID=A0A2P5DQY7_PARAD|nr:Multi antimicrobial extrusion protein [Parasponia andersonii]